jgi:hypothetical protein
MSTLTLTLTLRRRPISTEPLYYELYSSPSLWSTVPVYSSEILSETDIHQRTRAEIKQQSEYLLGLSGKDNLVIKYPESLAELVE